MKDRELDALVAEKVMGWKDFQTSKFNGIFMGLPDGVSPPRSGNTSHHKEVPRYSADISAAWQVVEKIVGGQYEHTFHLERLTGRIAPGRWWATFDKNTLRPRHACSEDAPRAICLAAIKVAGVEVR